MLNDVPILIEFVESTERFYKCGGHLGQSTLHNWKGRKRVFERLGYKVLSRKLENVIRTLDAIEADARSYCL